MLQFFNSDGIRLAFVDKRPTGPDLQEPILLIHGFASNHAVNWANTLWIKTLTEAGRALIDKGEANAIGIEKLQHG
ncbi:MAG: hypothetical protein EBY21_15255, partial [Alphaproteobacteria bacterium]|nr:hypothetical protein [Alphaproteobacteria bacterium]